MRPVAGRGRRRLVPVAVLGPLILIAAVGGASAGVLLFVVFAASLPAVVVLHRRLLRARKRRGTAPSRPMIRTPAQLALAVVVVVGCGTLAVLLASVLLAVVAPSLVGDGSVLVRLLLVAFVLWPCVSLGRRCGRWWAFVGAAGLLPLLGFVMLVAGTLSSDAGFLALAVLGTASALALGSLQSEWEAGRRSSRDRRSASRPEAAVEPGAALAGSHAVVRARSNRAC
jgi:hypothetical protein